MKLKLHIRTFTFVFICICMNFYLEKILALPIENQGSLQNTQFFIQPPVSNYPSDIDLPRRLNDSYGNLLPPFNINNGHRTELLYGDKKKVVKANGYLFEIPSYASGITDIKPPSNELLPPFTSNEKYNKSLDSLKNENPFNIPSPTVINSELPVPPMNTPVDKPKTTESEYKTIESETTTNRVSTETINRNTDLPKEKDETDEKFIKDRFNPKNEPHDKTKPSSTPNYSTDDTALSNTESSKSTPEYDTSPVSDIQRSTPNFQQSTEKNFQFPSNDAKYSGGFGGSPGVLGQQIKPGYAIQQDGSIRDPDHQYKHETSFPTQQSIPSVIPNYSDKVPNIATSPPSVTQTFNTHNKYTGGFGGPPGILSPYDNKQE